MKRKDNTKQIRYGIVGGAVVLLVAVAGLGLFFGGGGEAQPYRTLDRPDASGPVEVIAYFSYTCPHCRALEELIEDWHATLPAGATFKRVHVALSESGRTLTKGHLALARLGAAEVNQPRIFRALHDRNRRFDSVSALADFVDGHGVDRETFVRTAGSSRIARQMTADREEFLALDLLGVPALVVDGKYVVNMDMGRQQALQTARELAIERVAARAGGATGTSSTAGTGEEAPS